MAADDAAGPDDAEAGAAPGGGYVLLPVPAELADDVAHEVTRLEWLARGAIRPWELDGLVALVRGHDADAVAMVRAVARATMEGRILVDVELAEALGMSPRELGGLIREVNDSAPPGVLDLVVLHRLERASGLVREVRMIPEHARRIEEAVVVARRLDR